MKTKTYIQPAIEITKVSLSTMLCDSGSAQMNIVDKQDTQQSGAMSPARTLYI